MSEAVGIDPQARARGEAIPERNTVVPPFAKPIKDFSVRVKQRVGDVLQEVPPGFTIGEVAPEYRWAIDPDTGVIMDQATFKQDYQKWYNAHYTMQGLQVEGEPQSIPHVLDFVTMKVHPEDPTKVIPMSTRLDRPVVLNPPLLYDQHGENPLTPEELKAREEGTSRGAKMEQLLQLNAAGDITDEVFVKRSKELFGDSVAVGEGGTDSADPAAAGSPPPAGFELKPAEETVTEEPADETAPELTPPVVEMAKTLCGKEVKKKGVHLHQLRCKKCLAIKEAQKEE